MTVEWYLPGRDGKQLKTLIQRERKSPSRAQPATLCDNTRCGTVACAAFLNFLASTNSGTNSSLFMGSIPKNSTNRITTMAAPKTSASGTQLSTPKKRKANDESVNTHDDIPPERVRQLAKECLESATKLNNLVELLDVCGVCYEEMRLPPFQSPNPSIQNASAEASHTALVALQHVFSKLLDRGDLKRPKKSNTKSAKDPKTKVTEWLRDLRGQYVAQLLKHLSAGAPDNQVGDQHSVLWHLSSNGANVRILLQITGLQILLGMVKHESEHHHEFQNDLFERVVEACVSNDNLAENVLELLIRDINAFDDVRYYFYKDFG